ncbi:AgrD family cyclic lactone autoinducer peptide [Eubacterium callanderi]|uniref:Cyclic lactone autoinducer peptide n=1 Tax=Eubacterium callanderi TaxID=53442 RepID=A0A853JS98_9FIRM|nr:cyclic lactone autoinducer peptide [Eubacterium callanderi]
MKKLKEFFTQKLHCFLSRRLVSMSRLAAITAVASKHEVCVFWFHQPEVPNALDDFELNE